MKLLLRFTEILGLCLTLLPSLAVFFGRLSLERNQDFMLAGSILWFVARGLRKT